MLGHRDFMFLPIVDAWRIAGDVRLTFFRGKDHAVRLTGSKLNIVPSIFASARDRMCPVIRVTDGVLVVDEISATREETAFVHFDNVTDTADVPFDPTASSSAPLIITDASDEDVVRADLVDGTSRRDGQALRMGIEIMPIAM